jgi:hypothetical protein
MVGSQLFSQGALCMRRHSQASEASRAAAATHFKVSLGAAYNDVPCNSNKFLELEAYQRCEGLRSFVYVMTCDHAKESIIFKKFVWSP